MSDDARPQFAAAAFPSAAGWLRLRPSLPWLIALLALARALAAPAALLHDPDTYLHIAAGRWMLAHAALPGADPFSFTVPGARWLAGEWGGELVLALAWRLAGWGGTVVLAAACFALALGLLTRFLLRRLAPLPAALAALAGAALVQPHLLARPHVLALPLLVLWCGALLGARDDAAAPPWRALPAMTLWASLHGSFMFGLALAGFVAAEAVLRPAPGVARAAEARRWAGFLVAAVAAALLNPYGVGALVQPLRLMAMPALQTGFGEWLPADLAAFPALEAWLLGAVALGYMAPGRLPWTRLVLLLGLIHMALAHVRHADLLGLVAPLALAAGLAPAVAAWLAPAASSALVRGAAALAAPAGRKAQTAALLAAALLAAPVALRPVDRAGDPVTPQAALDAAHRLGLTGPVFNSEAFGGYLVFAGVPVFIDGRIELYGNDFLAAYLAAERGDPGALAALLGDYRIGWTLLQAQAPAVAALDRLPGWRRAYADAQAVVHVRD
ncbi:MAG: hypothetical protein JO032_04530 [Alphaproteobacteria bacterium]|nr:hypothetical protein [Alphaproteobacteria bacterium]